MSAAPASPAAAVPPSRTAQRVGRVLDGLLLALCVLLVALSYYGFTLYCESFGCLGLGLVWTLWAVLAAGGSAVALGVRAWQLLAVTQASGSGVARFHDMASMHKDLY